MPRLFGENNVSKRPDVRFKISQKLRGRKITWNRKISKTMKKLCKAGKFKNAFTTENNPMKKTEIREKNSKSQKRHNEMRNSFGIAHPSKGLHIWSAGNHPKGMKGKKHTEETVERIRKSSPHGEKSHLWQGGKSFEVYPEEFRVVRRQVLIRDNNTCQMTGKTNCKLNAHHIDYDPENNQPENIVLLCDSAHGKTNTRRDFWEPFFMSGFYRMNLRDFHAIG